MSKSAVQSAVGRHLAAKQEVESSLERLKNVLMRMGWKKFRFRSEDVSSAEVEWEGEFWFHPSLREQVAAFGDGSLFQHGKRGAHGRFAEFLEWMNSLPPEHYVDLS